MFPNLNIYKFLKKESQFDSSAPTQQSQYKCIINPPPAIRQSNYDSMTLTDTTKHMMWITMSNVDEQCVLSCLRIHSTLLEIVTLYVSCHENNEIALHEGLRKFILCMTWNFTVEVVYVNAFCAWLTCKYISYQLEPTMYWILSPRSHVWSWVTNVWGINFSHNITPEMHIIFIHYSLALERLYGTLNGHYCHIQWEA